MVLTEEQMTEQADAAYLASLFGGLTDERTPGGGVDAVSCDQFRPILCCGR